MMLADAHLHLFRNGFPGLYGESLLRPDIEVYENLRRAHGIAAGLVVGYEGEGIDPANNAYICALAAERPWMHTVAYADVHSAPSADVVTAILESGHAGVALYVTDPAKGAAAAAYPTSAWNALHQGRALVSLNTVQECLALITPAIENFSGCTFLISHMGLPGSYRQPLAMADAEARLAPLLRLAALPNVMVKISAPYAISDPAFSYPLVAAKPFLDLILNRFGAERYLWGSDFSPALDHVSFAQTISYPWLERLGDVDRALVMGGIFCGCWPAPRNSRADYRPITPPITWTSAAAVSVSSAPNSMPQVLHMHRGSNLAAAGMQLDRRPRDIVMLEGDGVAINPVKPRDCPLLSMPVMRLAS